MNKKIKLSVLEMVALSTVLSAVKDELSEDGKTIAEVDSVLKKLNKKLGKQESSYIDLASETLKEEVAVNE